MPSYVLVLEVPPGTTEDDPVEISFLLPVGILTAVGFLWPPGPQGEVGVRLLHNRHTVVPAQEDQWLAWDSGQVTFPTQEYLEQNAQEVVVQGKSPAANFNHTITVRLDVDTAPTTTSIAELSSDLERIQQAMEG